MEVKDVIEEARKLRWKSNEDELSKEFDFRDFNSALSFVNIVGEISEELNHHPEIWFTWGKVKLSITTHDAGHVTVKDLEFARRVNESLAG